MFSLIDEYKPERLVLYYQIGEGITVTVFNGTIEEWNGEDHPYYSSLLNKKDAVMLGETLLVEIYSL